MKNLVTYDSKDVALLCNIPVPEETKTYKPVSHKELIDLTGEALNDAGFVLDNSYYTYTHNGNVLVNKMVIKNVSDSQMQLQIAWQNSYNKQVSLKFAIGVNVMVCSNGCVSGDMGAYKRKHTGDIAEITPKIIREYISSAGDKFRDIQIERDMMKNIEISKRTKAELIGRLYLEEKIINSTQLNIIQREFENPTFDYGSENSLWETYQYVTFALKGEHPTLWMNSHLKAHEFFKNEIPQKKNKSEKVLENNFTNQLSLI
jgi:hypothetical protein